jgi:MATE family multidrug resistance protein
VADAGWFGEARRFAALALPMVVSRLGVAAFGIADGLMLARFSTQQLAVQGVADPLIGRVMEVAMAAVTAGLALAAQARAGGPDQRRAVGQVWHNALALSLGAAVVGTVVGLLGVPLLRALDQPAELIEPAGRVLAVLGLGVLPALVGLVCGGLLEALGQPLRVAAVVVLANVANIALNQWLIFGAFGVPPLGALGAALSTLFVRLAMAMVLLAMLWWMSERAAYGLRARFDVAAWRAGAEQRRRGLAGAGNVGVLALLSLALPVMAGWLGSQAVAQVTVLFLALAPAMVVAWGLGDAAGLRVAALQGEGRGGLRRGGHRLAALLGTVITIAVLGYGLAPRPLLSLVSPDRGLVDSVVPLVPLGLLALVGDAASAFHAAMLRSLGVLRGPFLAHLGSGLLVLLLAAALSFGLGMGLVGLLLAHGVSALLRAGVLAVLYERHARRLDAVREVRT